MAAYSYYLVLFVGTGASMSQPTGMPDFGRLAETLANKADYHYDLPRDVSC